MRLKKNIEIILDSIIIITIIILTVILILEQFYGNILILDIIFFVLGISALIMLVYGLYKIKSWKMIIMTIISDWAETVIERDKKCVIYGTRQNLEAHHVFKVNTYEGWL